jgi:hypothetical protein
MFPVVQSELACVLPPSVYEVSFSRESPRPGVISERVRSYRVPECPEPLTEQPDHYTNGRKVVMARAEPDKMTEHVHVVEQYLTHAFPQARIEVVLELEPERQEDRLPLLASGRAR